MSYQALAFFTGLFGSIHCIAMCGPLMMLLPFQNQSIAQILFHRILYQIGRIVTYALLGALAGLIGLQFQEMGFQKLLSLFSGILLIVFAIFHFIPNQVFNKKGISLPLPRAITNLLAKLLAKPSGSLYAGVINGLLPCGMVYMAIAGSINMYNLNQSILFMVFFGLGTCPLMLLAAISPILFKRKIKLQSLTPYLFLVIGFWLCLRGSDLPSQIFPNWPISHQVNCK